MMKLLCWIIGHRRSRRRAIRDVEGWKSRCKFCGERMERIGAKNWVLEKGST